MPFRLTVAICAAALLLAANRLTEREHAERLRAAILAETPELADRDTRQLAEEVAASLGATGTFRSKQGSPQRVTLVNSGSIAAFAAGDGQIYVTKGFVDLLGAEKGLWAAALATEIGLNLNHHEYKSYQRSLDTPQTPARKHSRRHATPEDRAQAEFDNIVKMAYEKAEQAEETEAERLGLAMLVEAGYHPDFAVALYRKIGLEAGRSSKLAGLLGLRPVWETREKRLLKECESARRAFRARWPDAAQSPGGAPPAIPTPGAFQATATPSGGR